jgi:hypothetical protein
VCDRLKAMGELIDTSVVVGDLTVLVSISSLGSFGGGTGGTSVLRRRRANMNPATTNMPRPAITAITIPAMAPPESEADWPALEESAYVAG